MGERYRGEWEYAERPERDSDVETKEHLDAMNRLLAKLVEQGGDLPSDVKKGLRVQIQSHLQALGLQSLEDYDGLTAIYQRLQERRTNLPTPPNYPSRDGFRDKLNEIYQARGTEQLPAVPRRLRATSVAEFGQGDWRELEGRGGVDVVDYLYNLGKVISSELAYTTTFDATDAIEVDDSWRIENGRHRALALRVLGSRFVDNQGIDRWVEVRKEE